VPVRTTPRWNRSSRCCRRTFWTVSGGSPGRQLRLAISTRIETTYHLEYEAYQRPIPACSSSVTNRTCSSGAHADHDVRTTDVDHFSAGRLCKWPRELFAYFWVRRQGWV
jgi:hypothetical protein